MSLGSKPCISVRGVSKKFARSLKRSFVYGGIDVARAVVGLKGTDTLRESEFWALRNISFDLMSGQSIGIVGVNGSGKTTLLRIISGIINPTLGSIEVHGRIAPMIALGAGFKPVLSGRENVFLNLSILGVPRKEIPKRFDSILDFSELHESIDAPVGTYSSGMISRLGFACAIHTDPSILIVDEVLSVGDARFRVKCRNKINELRRKGTSMLLVSHSAVLIETLCDECVYMQKGHVIEQGDPRSVLKRYEDDQITRANAHNKGTFDVDAKAHQQISRVTQSESAITSVQFLSDGVDRGFWTCGTEGTISCRISSKVPMSDMSVNLMIFDNNQPGAPAVQFISSSRDVGGIELPEGESEVTIAMPKVGLPAGMYRVKLSLSQGKLHDIKDVADGLRLVVRDRGQGLHCSYYQPRDWMVNGVVRPQIEMVDETESLDVVGDS